MAIESKFIMGMLIKGSISIEVEQKVFSAMIHLIHHRILIIINLLNGTKGGEIVYIC